MLGQVLIDPLDAVRNVGSTRVGITLADVFFEIVGGTSPYATLKGPNNSRIQGVAAGTLKVKASLPAAYCVGGVALSTEFNVIVSPVGSEAPHIGVTDILLDNRTVESTVMTGTTALISGGFFNLNIAQVTMADATKKLISWTVKSGDGVAYIDASKLEGGILHVTSAPLVGSTKVAKTITLTATIVGGGSTAGSNFTKDFTFTLNFNMWAYSNPVISIELTATHMNLYERDIKNLLGMVKLHTVDDQGVPYYNGKPITVSDLEWEVVTRTAGGNLAISGSNIEGKNAGIVTIKAKLKGNDGGATYNTTTKVYTKTDIYSATIEVTIWGIPTISDNHKAAFWFLFQAVNDGIVFVPCTENDFTDNERLTGVTNRTWATTDDDFNKTTFMKKHPGAIIGGRMSAMGYTPGVTFEGDPRPMTYPDTGRYYVFFIRKEAGKADERVYANGAKTPAGNKLFLLDLEHKSPSIILQNQQGAVKETAMWTHKFEYDAGLTGILTEADVKKEYTQGNTYYNNMGIPIGIYRFRYWYNSTTKVDEISFINGTFYN